MATFNSVHDCKSVRGASVSPEHSNAFRFSIIDRDGAWHDYTFYGFSTEKVDVLRDAFLAVSEMGDE